MEPLKIFIDGSTDPVTKIGYGATLIVGDITVPPELLVPKIRVKMFEQTTSTKLELQCLLWALNEIGEKAKKIIIYTDSQNIIRLPQKGEEFRKNNYQSRGGKPLSHSELYREFYTITDKLDCEFIKVAGHQRSDKKDNTSRIFTLLDRAARKALRSNNG